MKTIFSAVALLCLASSVNAQTSNVTCADVEELAVEIMQKRQVNYDIMLLINTTNEELFDRPALLNILQPMIDRAYSEVPASNADAREQQVEKFKKFWAQQCEENNA